MHVAAFAYFELGMLKTQGAQNVEVRVCFHACIFAPLPSYRV